MQEPCNLEYETLELGTWNQRLRTEEHVHKSRPKHSNNCFTSIRRNTHALRNLEVYNQSFQLFTNEFLFCREQGRLQSGCVHTLRGALTGHCGQHLVLKCVTAVFDSLQIVSTSVEDP
jgi:hypothetical protein